MRKSQATPRVLCRMQSHPMMKYKTYFAKVEFDSDAKRFHGQVIGIGIGIRDVIAFQANHTADIEKAFDDSVEGCFGFRKERGEARARS
jgi:predicted HicB family RNase H-like nuclease